MFRNKLFKNNFIYLSTVILGGVFGYLFQFAVSHRLPVAQYGELQAVISFSVIFTVFFSAFSFFTIKNSVVFALHKDRGGQALFLFFVKQKFRQFVLVFLVILFVLAPFIKHWLRLDDYLGLLVVGISVIISFYYGIYGNSIQGWSDFLAAGMIGLAAVLIKLASGYALAVFFPQASAVAFSFLISAATGWLLARAYFRRKWPLLEENKANFHWREKYFSGVSFRHDMLNVFLFTLGLTTVSSADIVFVKSVAAAEVAGYYAALSIMGKAVFSLNFAIASVLFPEACADGYQKKPASRKSILGSYGLMSVISFPLILFFYFSGQFVMGHTFGQNYHSVGTLLWLFGLMSFVLSLLTLEAKLAMARYDFRSSILLFIALFLLLSGITLFHADIKIIALVVTGAFLAGWLMLLALNFSHRLSYVKKWNETKS